MRAVVQRVIEASVKTESGIVSSIENGMLTFVGIHRNDIERDMHYIADKLLDIRIFNDDKDVMNFSLTDIKGELLIVSQFTLYGDARKGRRPSYSDAMPADKAYQFYNNFIDYCKSKYSGIKSGVFGASMNIHLINNGPVTILLDSKTTV